LWALFPATNQIYAAKVLRPEAEASIQSRLYRE
jgi:hypothetical protein